MRGYRQAFTAYADWMIWKQTNMLVFEECVTKIKEVVRMAVEQVDERWNIMDRDVRSRGGSKQAHLHSTRWIRPFARWLKVSFDGEFLEDTAGVGVIIRGPKGERKLIEAKPAQKIRDYRT